MLLPGHQKLWARWLRFQLADRSDASLEQLVGKFLAGLPPSVARRVRPTLAAGGVEVDWCRVPRPPRYHRDEMRLRGTVLSDTERARLAAAPLSPRDRALIGVLYTLRLFEAAQVRWRDLDLKAGLVFVRRGKGDQAAWTVLMPSAVKALEAWRAASTSASEDDYVFPGAGGGLARDWQIGGWVADALVAAGVARRGRRAHAFRRTFATEFLRQHPEQLRQLQVLMRHQQLATTVGYDYATVDEYQDKVKGLRL